MLQDILTNEIVFIVVGFTGLMVIDCTNQLIYHWLTFDPQIYRVKPAVKPQAESVTLEKETTIPFVQKFEVQQPIALKTVAAQIPDPWDLPLEELVSV